MVSGKSRKWRCDLGHIWELVVGSHKTTECPVCSKQQLLTGFDDLEITNSDFAIEADEWDPTPIIFGGHKNMTRSLQKT